MNKDHFEYPFEDDNNQLFHIHSNNLSCHLTNFGARIVALKTLDKYSKMIDVVLGFDSIEEYFNANDKYHGATVGRYANRIANGVFEINGKAYQLPQNSHTNTLHGGVEGFHLKFWKCLYHDQSKVIFEYISPHLEEGFPGELTTKVTYTIQGSTLIIEYDAKTSQDTVINFTNHSYFNLNGEGSGSILDHKLLLNTEYFTPINEILLPTGSMEMVTDTPFDFTSPKPIGKDIELEDDQLKKGNGYDHNFVLNQYVEHEINFAARAIGDASGVQMEVWTEEPGVQLYTANHFDGSDIGKSGQKYQSRGAFCLETQHFPNSPNQQHFPSTILSENQSFKSKTEYRFSIV